MRRLLALLLALALSGCGLAPTGPIAPVEPPWQPAPPEPVPIPVPPDPVPVPVPPPPPPSDVAAALDAVKVGMTEAAVRDLFSRPPVIPEAGGVRELRWWLSHGGGTTMLYVRFGTDGKVTSRGAAVVEEVP
jgi:hypothetical protein